MAHDESISTKKKLEDELECCHRIGLSDVEMTDLQGDPARGGYRHALRFPKSAEFHPIK